MSDDQNGLPPGWAWATFGDVAEVESDLVDPANHMDAAHIAPNHIESGTGRLLPHATIGVDGVTSPKHLFGPGQILYSKIRPYLAKAVVVDFEGLCSADMYPVRSDIEAAFLHQWLISPMFTVLASQSQGRTVLPKINQRKLVTKAVPVAPLNEQKRIVAKIEALQLRSEAAKEALDAIGPLLEKFRQSVLAAAFRGDLTKAWRAKHPDVEPATELLKRIRAERRRRWEEAKPGKKYKEPEPVDASGLPELPEGWCWAALGELAGTEPNSMTDGPFGSKLKSAHYVESGVRVIRLGNLGVAEFKDADKSYITHEHFETLRKHEVLPGDLLIAALAEPVGRCCQVPEGIGTAIVKADCIKFLPHPAVAKQFLLHWLNSPPGTANCEQLSHGMGRLRVNMANLRVMPVALAPKKEQAALVRIVDDLLGWLDSVRQLVVASESGLPPLNQSILAKAFRGELVPQDPNDEPASVLLERIRAEREAKGAKTTKRGRGRAARR